MAIQQATAKVHVPLDPVLSGILNRTMDGPTFMRALFPGLTNSCGPLVQQNAQLHDGRGVSTLVYAGQLNKKANVERLLNLLACSIAPDPFGLGQVYGFRAEVDGKWTTVTYSSYSGVVVISTTIY